MVRSSSSHTVAFFGIAMLAALPAISWFGPNPDSGQADSQLFFDCSVDNADDEDGDGNTNYAEDQAANANGDCDDDDSDKDGVADYLDCRENDGFTFPGAATNDSTTDCMTDLDGDDYGDDSVTGVLGLVQGSDCNDNDGSIHPFATILPVHINDNVDQDCNFADECYADVDNDNYGDDGSDADGMPTIVSENDASGGGCEDADEEKVGGDCDDSATGSSIHPFAVDDPGDDTDENCSGTVACYIDMDDDEYGGPDDEESVHKAVGGVSDDIAACASSNSDGYDDTGDDCNDASAEEFPGQSWFPDCDGDGFWAMQSILACLAADADAAGLCLDSSAPDGGWTHTDPGSTADCDDEDPAVAATDSCGVCGGDNSSCGIFDDGFESGDLTAWN